MDIVVTAETGGTARRIGWIGIQPDGSVSVGLNDRTFVSPDFKAQNFVWSAYNRQTIQYLVPTTRDGLRGIRNPHLTFHPPHWFHLRETNGKRLFEGIGDLDLMLRQDGTVPWVRFVSKQVSTLAPAANPRKPERTRFITVRPGTEECSIGLAVDFVRADVAVKPDGLLSSELFACSAYTLHVSTISLPTQIATLSWYHQR